MASNASARHAWSAVVSCCVMFVVWSGICWNTATLYADPIIGEWGIQRSEFMVVLTLISLGNAIVSLVAYGKLVEMFGIRRLFLAGGALSVAAMAIFALAQNSMMLYVAALLLGIGYSPFGSNTANLVVGKWFKKNNNTLIGIVQTCGSVAGIVFAAVMTVLISGLGWRISYWFTAGAVVVGTVVCYLLYRGDPSELGERPLYGESPDISVIHDSRNKVDLGVSFGEMFKVSRLYCLVVGYLLVGIVGYAVLGSLALMASDFGYASASGIVVSTSLLTSAVAMVPMGKLIDKVGSCKVIALCIACVVASMAILGSGSVSLPMLFAAAALSGIAYDATNIPIGASVREAFGERDYGKKLGFIGAFDYAGVAFGATILACFYDAFGNYQIGLMVFTVMAAVGMALVFVGIGKQGRSLHSAKAAAPVAAGAGKVAAPVAPKVATPADVVSMDMFAFDEAKVAAIADSFERFMDDIHTKPCTDCLIDTCSSMGGDGASSMCGAMCRTCSREGRRAA